MNRQDHGTREMDGFRIVALSRIPRCAGCPRFEQIRAAYIRGGYRPAPVPASRIDCRHEVCAPLLPRLFVGPAAQRHVPPSRGVAAQA